MTALKCGSEQLVNAFRIGQHIFIAGTQDKKSTLLQILVASCIITKGELSSVAIAIDFHDEPCLQTGKIDVMVAQLDLLAKVPALRAKRMNEAPEPNFWHGWPGSEFFPQLLAHHPPPQPSP
ncbi:hypothetical protein VW35_16285 [Devosia soli]|uniref:Uncharacterized protein n=1 Tax=Devosia soli TaxID=361041 RepID=A0A0F5L3Y5_9HYPH|nr:hypothetical protein [Devosia soli]KKB76940.1 hypothetical protein VW35_16285 [Devosia soli]